jgi:hypothetical protein
MKVHNQKLKHQVVQHQKIHEIEIIIIIINNQLLVIVMIYRSHRVKFTLKKNFFLNIFYLLETQSASLAAASESDSASQTDEIRRYRRPFKKPIIPSISKADQHIKLARYPSMKVCNFTTISTPLRRRRRNCRSADNSRLIDIDEDPSTPSSTSSFSLAINSTNYAGKRKRSRAIIHDDFRLRTNSLHDYDMTCIDDANL